MISSEYTCVSVETLWEFRYNEEFCRVLNIILVLQNKYIFNMNLGNLKKKIERKILFT